MNSESRSADSLLLIHFFSFCSSDENLFNTYKLLMCFWMTSARHMSGVQLTVWGQEELKHSRKWPAPTRSMTLWWKALRAVGEFIHRSSCKSWLDESKSVQLPLCKVNEKHPESGQICREHHWSWPTQSMISEIKGRRREGNLFTVSHKSAKGNSSPQAVFEKLKGKSTED